MKPYLNLCWAAIRTDVFMVPLYLTLCCFALLIATKATAFHRACLAGVLFGYVLIMIGMPHQGYYYWFLFPILMSIVLSHLQSRRNSLFVLAVVTAVAINPDIRECVKGFSLPTDQTFIYSQRIITDYVPPTASILTDVRSYYVMRSQYTSLYVTDGVDPLQKVMSSIQYCVFSYMHMRQYGGMFMPKTWTHDARATYLKDHFELVYDGLPVHCPSWHGVPLGSTPIGYGVVVYRRLRQPSALLE